MQYRTLGASGLLVSPICLGTMTFGSPVEEADAIRLIHAAIDLGINFVDTANVYEGYARYLGSAGGVAEEIVGKALRGRRDKLVVATKVGAPVGPGPQDRGLSAVHILRELDNSLRRLQTDCIDLYIIHWPDKHVPMEITLAAMETAVRQGKIRYFGAFEPLGSAIVRTVMDRRATRRPARRQLADSLQPAAARVSARPCVLHQAWHGRHALSGAARRAVDRKIPSRPGAAVRFAQPPKSPTGSGSRTRPCSIVWNESKCSPGRLAFPFRSTRWPGRSRNRPCHRWWSASNGSNKFKTPWRQPASRSRRSISLRSTPSVRRPGCSPIRCAADWPASKGPTKTPSSARARSARSGI